MHSHMLSVQRCEDSASFEGCKVALRVRRLEDAGEVVRLGLQIGSVLQSSYIVLMLRLCNLDVWLYRTCSVSADRLCGLQCDQPDWLGSHLERVKAQSMQALLGLQGIKWGVVNTHPCYPAPPAAFCGLVCCTDVCSAYSLTLPPPHLLE